MCHSTAKAPQTDYIISDEKSKMTLACGAETTDQWGGTMHNLHNDMQIGSKKGVMIDPLPTVTNPRTNSHGSAPENHIHQQFMLY